MTTNDHHSEITARFASLRERIAAGTITRHTWQDFDDSGRERVCLLLALASEVRFMDEDGDVNHRASRCPAWLLPLWFAELTPCLDDASSDAAWPAMLLRYADVVERAALVLDAAAWRRCDFATRRTAVIVAREQTDDAIASSACDHVIALCDRLIAGDEPTEEEWMVAAEATARAAGRTAQAAAGAADGAFRAAWGAARAAESAARASWGAARAAESAARAARAANQTAAGAAAWAARAANRTATGAEVASDRIIDECLTAIERELARATRPISGGVSE